MKKPLYDPRTHDPQDPRHQSAGLLAGAFTPSTYDALTLSTPRREKWLQVPPEVIEVLKQKCKDIGDEPDYWLTVMLDDLTGLLVAPRMPNADSGDIHTLMVGDLKVVCRSSPGVWPDARRYVVQNFMGEVMEYATGNFVFDSRDDAVRRTTRASLEVAVQKAFKIYNQRLHAALQHTAPFKR